MSKATPLILLAAGGTGGHLFPAEATAVALAARGAAVELVTDARAAAYAGSFPARAMHAIPSATFRGRDPLSLMRTTATLAYGTARAFALMGRRKPDAVVGFGGYPTIPPIIAARLRGIVTLIHEQNGVMGRANRLLAPRVTAIASGFPQVAAVSESVRAKMTYTGNPVRDAVKAAAQMAVAPLHDGGPLHILVFGGSQGAQVMGEVVPDALMQLAPTLRARLRIVQQARAENADVVRAVYAAHGIAAEVAPFFADLPARMAASHLVIARSGASTVAELAVIGRPAILVPLPHALDQDQHVNAGFLEAAGGAIRVAQPDFTPAWLAAQVAALAVDPARLAAMAQAARGMGKADAADQLAALILDRAGSA